ncbi:class I SAM-dependent methyltransferase [Falsiroseomonas selenitidurans]|uniref:Class I SAM-dependent methyltransferase n=1 Tax=Falsiroseomonas selenitidurans TaxID=2716335 RepID=A0ABX1E2E4_9PROT|nr:class I SAM-dependent methyltransferase [Falsiroseomonas selenitidurans]NKC31337.1 class I SAM-dependent methyltransferase [Falsiroseomonas selenitidurans]
MSGQPGPAAVPPASILPKKRDLPPPTLEDVRAAYRLFLNREPENAGVLERHLAASPSFAALTQRFARSDEFIASGAPPPPPLLPLTAPPLAVEVAADPGPMAAMLARIGGYWERIGAEAPHWSVLTDQRFLPERIAETKEAFYASARYDADLIVALLARQGIAPDSLPRCLEFGCGVGRVTLALGRIFRQVTGCDISPPHLELARQEAAARGATNLSWHRSTMAMPMPEARWDFWYSRIVLQHNPPPVIAMLLRRAFAGLAPGGVAIFQVPTHCLGYRFRVAEYLAQTAPVSMEMHVIPQASVFALAAEAGLQVLEVREDSHVVSRNAASWLSNLFVLRRPA